MALALWTALGIACSTGDRVAVDLLAEFPSAKIKRPAPAAFSVIDATLSGETRRALFSEPDSRVGWSVAVPADAWLKVAIGLKEDAWTVPGDGVLFQIGVSTGQQYDELLSLMLNPHGNPGDRGWHDLVLDLSPYAGQTVDVVMNTLHSAPGRRDEAGDLALWGEPRLVVR
jgi:hypothetical protein